MNDRKFNEKLLEFFMELAKPKKYEVGYADGIRIVQDGLSILGLDASDILGFTKPANERSIRRLRGTQAWFKKMYEDGWRYTGTFEYEGLPYNGFVVMERELPNKTLDAIRDEIEVILKEDEESQYIHVPNPEILRGTEELDERLKEAMSEKSTPYVPLDERMKTTKKALKKMGYKEDEITVMKAREPREGFESDINDFMVEATKEMKTLEEIFFDETGKNAVWHGKETKTFKQWKEGMSNNV